MSKIAWTTVSWNPIVGCSRVSDGCELCYAISEAVRKHTTLDHYKGTVRKRKDGTYDWTGKLGYAPHKLKEPISWTRKPRKVFVNSVSDVFHPSADLEYVAAMWGVMAMSPINQFQILTKRPENAAEWLNKLSSVAQKAGYQSEVDYIHAMACKHLDRQCQQPEAQWPLANVWLGTSVEDQDAADTRIPHLMNCPAEVRWLSAEPMIGAIDMASHLETGRIDWVVVGGESERRSGPKPTMKRARPLDPAWVTKVLDDCKAANVPFFMKQGGQANWPIWREDKFEEFPAQFQVRQYP